MPAYSALSQSSRRRMNLAKPQRHSAIAPSDAIRMGRLARSSPGAAAVPHVRSRRADPPPQDKRPIA